jgi:hypothetical protein
VGDATKYSWDVAGGLNDVIGAVFTAAVISATPLRIHWTHVLQILKEG